MRISLNLKQELKLKNRLMKSAFLFFILFISIHSGLIAQSITGQELLEKSIQYHDPKGNWDTFKGPMPFRETRPNGPDRRTTMNLDNRKAYFHLDQTVENYRIEKIIENGTCSYKVNQQTTVADSLQKKFRLTCPQIERIKNYYVYLWGMPMKLRDPGTQIQKEVTKTTFMEKEVLSMKVTYDKAVGEDIWYFYFNPSNYALVGYRFYHDESVNDGEYIPLEGEETIKGIRFPKTRTWFVNKDDRLLGADILEGK